MSVEDADREERILMEVVVDAYGSQERAMGWYYYLADRIIFPFYAECVTADKRSPIELGKQVAVLQMSGEDYCEHEIYVDISWNDRLLAIPLAQIKPLHDEEGEDIDDDTLEAVEDWHYWKNRGYGF
jgi:hypothetical protein